MSVPNQFWRGTLGEAKVRFLNQQPKGEMTLLIEGRTNCLVETPSEDQLEHELGELISRGHTLSTVMTHLMIIKFLHAIHHCYMNSSRT
jgi:16S rRNA (cytidine1402-2'-O)-methyltransferase